MSTDCEPGDSNRLSTRRSMVPAASARAITVGATLSRITGRDLRAMAAPRRYRGTGDAVTDLHEHEPLAATGTTLALTGHLDEAAQHLDGARILVTGPLSEGLQAPNLDRERVYRDERFPADMELRAEVELDLGRHRNAVPYLCSVLHRHPLNEGFTRLLMLALFRADRGAEALTVYDTYRRRVAAEPGTDPGRALKALQARILAQGPEPAAVTAVPLTRPAPGRNGSAERS
ncbi:AfsR/SARP family transcriptional regulator [Streptomyces sp. NPDC087538]|uniref:AfsR/SARP family transcriptional regulator n=1 Tax=Streptomyces sp. NPDC087538 TaxID=3365797 RepID=UPI00381EB4CF